MNSPQLVICEREHVTRAVAARLTEAGYQQDAATITAEHLVQAEAERYWSHGLRLVPAYLEEVLNGSVNPAQAVELTSDAGVTLVFDGHHAPGHHALSVVMEHCIERAHERAVAMAWVSQLPHTGRLADYVAQATGRGLSAILTVTSVLDERNALVSPPGSARRLLGSNPLAIGISDGAGVEVCYDGSTAAIPFYALLHYWETGQELAEESVVDSLGQPSRDPDAFFKGGAIRPAGGPRGFGLSLALALLAQLRCPRATDGGTNAFVMVIGPQGALDGSLADTVRGLREAGAHLPGSRRAESRLNPRLQTYASTLQALRDAGVDLP